MTDAGIVALIDDKSNVPHWIWKGPTNYGQAYGQPKYRGRYVRPELWREYREDPLPDGVRVGVDCGTARCVNPGHMVIQGTVSEARVKHTQIEVIEQINMKLDLIIKHLGIDPFGES